MSESQLGPSCHCCLPADSVEMQGHVPRFPSQPASFSRLAEVETTTCVRNPQSQWRTVKPSLKAEQNGLHVVESFDLFLTGENDGTVVSIPSDWIFVHHHCWYPYDIPMISLWYPYDIPMIGKSSAIMGSLHRDSHGDSLQRDEPLWCTSLPKSANYSHSFAKHDLPVDRVGYSFLRQTLI